MNEVTLAGSVSSPDIRVLGGKLDSVPFSPYHVLVILVLALVGFIEGYDLAVTGSLIVLAKQPLHVTPADIQWLVAGPSRAAAGSWPPPYPIICHAKRSCRSG
jgi:hypothetical protein